MRQARNEDSGPQRADSLPPSFRPTYIIGPANYKPGGEVGSLISDRARSPVPLPAMASTRITQLGPRERISPIAMGPRLPWRWRSGHQPDLQLQARQGSVFAALWWPRRPALAARIRRRWRSDPFDSSRADPRPAGLPPAPLNHFLMDMCTAERERPGRRVRCEAPWPTATPTTRLVAQRVATPDFQC